MPTLQEQRRENAAREQRREREERERIAKQAGARARHEAWQAEQAKPHRCFGCDQLFRRENLVAVLFGLYLCRDCAEVASKGAAPVKIRRVAGVNAKGQWKYSYTISRPFSCLAVMRGKPLQYGPKEKPNA